MRAAHLPTFPTNEDTRMPKTTLGASTGSPTRRRFLSTATAGLAVTAAVGTAHALAVDPADDRALELWERRHAQRQPLLDAYRVYHAARARMPAWARPGPRYMLADGSLTGDVSYSPAIQGLKHSDREGSYVDTRPDKASIQRDFYVNCAISDRDKALRIHAEQLHELAARVKAKKLEENRSGLTAANVAIDALFAQVSSIDEDVKALVPSTPNATAARILLDVTSEARYSYSVEDSFGMSVALIAFAHLRPALRGIIKAHVDELLDNPDRRLGWCQAYVGDSNAEGAETDAARAA
jgi:hypothetical protein